MSSRSTTDIKPHGLGLNYHLYHYIALENVVCGLNSSFLKVKVNKRYNKHRVST